jgi:hypothetical protein
MEFLIFSHLTLMTHIISYDVRFYNMTITLFILTIHGILSLIQEILHMNYGGKTFI